MPPARWLTGFASSPVRAPSHKAKRPNDHRGPTSEEKCAANAQGLEQNETRQETAQHAAKRVYAVEVPDFAPWLVLPHSQEPSQHGQRSSHQDRRRQQHREGKNEPNTIQ